MPIQIIITMIHRIIDNLFPIGGGAYGGLLVYEKYDFILWMHWTQYCEGLIMITVGALIGWLIKRFLDEVFPKKET